MKNSIASPPRVLAVLPHVIPSTTISVIKPLEALHRVGRISADFALEYALTSARVARADVVVFCRNSTFKYNGAWRCALQAGKPMIYDLDDNLFELPFSAPGAAKQRSPDHVRQLHDYLKTASLVRVYSEHLRTYVAQINAKVERVDGPLDWSLVPSQPSPLNSKGKVRIVYATSRIYDELMDLFLDDVERLLALLPDRVELFLWGCRCDRLSQRQSVRILKPTTNYDRFFRQFARSGFEIGLAPLLTDSFHLSKSNNKFREYGACRIAGIYSNVPVYTECVEHGATGLLVENQPNAWFEAITRLLDHPELRHKIQENAQLYARERYGQEQFCDVWLRQIESVLASPRSKLVPDVGPFPEPPAGNMTQSVAALTKDLARLLWRVVRSVGKREADTTYYSVQWLLNDLPILLRYRQSLFL